MILKNIKIPKNFKINLKNIDFLLWDTRLKYDLVVGNPPYKKLTKNKNIVRATPLPPIEINKGPIVICPPNKSVKNLFKYLIIFFISFLLLFKRSSYRMSKKFFGNLLQDS